MGSAPSEVMVCWAAVPLGDLDLCSIDLPDMVVVENCSVFVILRNGLGLDSAVDNDAVVNCWNVVPLSELVSNCAIDGPKVASVEFVSMFVQSEFMLIKLKPGAKKNGIIVRNSMLNEREVMDKCE
jgi:hypothetical protein